MKNRNVLETAGSFAATIERHISSPLKHGLSHDLDIPAPLPASRSAKIAVPIFDGLQMVDTEDIVKCISHENSTEIILTCGSAYKVSRVLKDYEQMLIGMNFFRIHNSCLINLRHVKKYIKGEGGFVLMSDGQYCEVSRRKKTSLIQRLALVPL